MNDQKSNNIDQIHEGQLEDFVLATILIKPTEIPFAVLVSPDGKKMVIQNMDDTVRMLDSDPDSATYRKELRKLERFPTAFSPDSRTIDRKSVV